MLCIHILPNFELILVYEIQLQMFWSPWYYLSQPVAVSSTGSHPRRGLKPTEVQRMHIYSGVLRWWSPLCRNPEASRDHPESAGTRSRSEVWQHIYSHSQSLPKALSLCHNHPATTEKRGRMHFPASQLCCIVCTLMCILMFITVFQLPTLWSLFLVHFSPIHKKRDSGS